eukprot:11867548-Ditylum_brightwellii.AAC.1
MDILPDNNPEVCQIPPPDNYSFQRKVPTNRMASNINSIAEHITAFKLSQRCVVWTKRQTRIGSTTALHNSRTQAHPSIIEPWKVQ